MYLKSIKAIGFKSFADKTNIEFDKEITAIVGPNGSGKSNIVDAIRWVLGEQSVKSLRGSEVMSDVIFTGSMSRESHKKASVILTFDNSDRYLNSDFNELEIKREVYKTGENDYFINNERVRLKDIHNLFLDTGTGNFAFNIISQGNITEIVNSKATDRRIIFESAAGVLKYKRRKEEALKKLDKTKDNLASIRLVIDELSLTVKPLKKQSEDAKKYLDFKNETSNIEIALLACDIEDFNKKYANIKEEIDDLTKKANNFCKDLDSSSLEKIKFEALKIDENISEINSKLISINDIIAKLSSEKQITIERQKYSNNKSVINTSLVSLKEEKFELQKKREVISADLEKLNEDKNGVVKELDSISNDLIMIKIKKSNLNSSLSELNKNILEHQNRIEITENNIKNGEDYPKPIKSILNNPKFTKVHNTLGNLIEVPMIYRTAINVTLGMATNFIVTENFDESKRCIEYLKSNNIGRATFFPLDTIKSRYVKDDKLDIIKENDDFVGIASDLVNFEKKYSEVVENQLGNVIVVKNLEALNKFGKILDFKYRLVSLEGDILFTGGAVSGGVVNPSINNKLNLKKLYDSLEKEKSRLKKIDFEYEQYENEYNVLDEKSILLNKKIILLSESINNKKLVLEEYDYEIESKEFEIKGMDYVATDKIEEELINLIEELTNKAKEKIILEKNLDSLKDKKDDVQNMILNLEKEYREKTTEFNKFNVLIKEKEIDLGKMEVSLENMLLTLNDDYNLTYEAALNDYYLDISKDEARSKVKYIKKEMDKLGNVNLGSIAEYERLNERYEFLEKQENDLKEASDNLHDIIDEMDDIMKEKFKKSFKEISSEFKDVFKKIFQGGKGELVLTDPSNLLTTGIEIIAEPPGKKITSTIALSGGEKSLTAICLLFSILNVRPVPFIVLDEAEAALDEANVDMFGKYINDKKKTSQFILITHKKRMMEYADSLYGITMQESGVSKIVSTMLED